MDISFLVSHDLVNSVPFPAWKKTVGSSSFGSRCTQLANQAICLEVATIPCLLPLPSYRDILPRCPLPHISHIFFCEARSLVQFLLYSPIHLNCCHNSLHLPVRNAIALTQFLFRNVVHNSRRCCVKF